MIWAIFYESFDSMSWGSKCLSPYVDVVLSNLGLKCLPPYVDVRLFDWGLKCLPPYMDVE